MLSVLGVTCILRLCCHWLHRGIVIGTAVWSAYACSGLAWFDGQHCWSRDTVVKYLDSNRHTLLVQWSEDVIKAGPFFGRSRVRFRVPPWVPNTVAQLHVTTSLSTGGGPVSCGQLSKGGFQVVYPLGLWSRSSGVVKVLYGYG